MLRNPPGSPVDRFAVARGAADWQTVAAAGPGRPLYLAQVPRGYYRRAGEAALTVSQAQTVQAPSLRLRIDTRQDPPEVDKRQLPRYLVVQCGETTLRCPVKRLATAVEVQLSGPAGLTGCDERRDGGLRDRKDNLLAARKVPVASVGGELRALVDGALLTRRGVDHLVVTATP